MLKAIALALIFAVRASTGRSVALSSIVSTTVTVGYAADGNNHPRGRNAASLRDTIGQVPSRGGEMQSDTHALFASAKAAPMETSVYAPSVFHRAVEYADRHAVVRAVLVLQQVVESPLRFSLASTLTALAYLSGLFAGKSELYSVRSTELDRSEDDAQS